MFYSSNYLLTALEDKLSMMLNTGLKPFLVKYVMFYFKVAIVDSSFKYFTGVARIALDDQSYSTKNLYFLILNRLGVSGEVNVYGTFFLVYCHVICK